MTSGNAAFAVWCEDKYGAKGLNWTMRVRSNRFSSVSAGAVTLVQNVRPKDKGFQRALLAWPGEMHTLRAMPPWFPWWPSRLVVCGCCVVVGGVVVEAVASVVAVVAVLCWW